MSLPGALTRELEERFGVLLGMRAVGGGSISRAARVETRNGPIFVKYGADSPPGLFESEAHGLTALRRASKEDLKIPEVLALSEAGGEPGGVRWIALEWLEPGKSGPREAASLGRGLARLHLVSGGGWGDEHDGFIGSLHQQNAAAFDWATFWAERRLRPQLALSGFGSVGAQLEWEWLFERLPELLAVGQDEGPAPLHGDLWSGNVLPLADGRTALVDPSFYRGHREVDLAMSDLFGGLPARARTAYLELQPLADGYEEVRRGIYQLYYLLVHVNLFGGGYASRTAAVLRQVLAV
jgi:protein-ribulosamine 3-kinase